jgi:hypothetical protein
VVYLMERDCCASGRADVASRLNKSLDDILCGSRLDLGDAGDGLRGTDQCKQLARWRRRQSSEARAVCG